MCGLLTVQACVFRFEALFLPPPLLPAADRDPLLLLPLLLAASAAAAAEPVAIETAGVLALLVVAAEDAAPAAAAPSDPSAAAAPAIACATAVWLSTSRFVALLAQASTAVPFSEGASSVTSHLRRICMRKCVGDTRIRMHALLRAVSVSKFRRPIHERSKTESGGHKKERKGRKETSAQRERP